MKRVITTELQQEEHKLENTLRPKLLSDYVGQEKIKSKFPPNTLMGKMLRKIAYLFKRKK